MQRLNQRRLVDQRTLLAQSLERITAPLARWKPGEALPKASQISKAAVNRYEKVPLQTIVAYTATCRTLTHYGLEMQPRLNRYQQTHDLGLGEVYLYFLHHWPRLTHRCWLGEDAFHHEREFAEKIEDAQLRNPRTGTVFLAIEFAGKYRTDRVAAFINEMRRREQSFMCF